MDPVSTTYSDTSTASISALYRDRRRTGDRVDTAALDGMTAKAPPSSESSSSDTQQGIRTTEKNEREPITYGPDGRRTDEKKSSAAQDASKNNQTTVPGATSKQDPQVQQEVARLQSIDAKVKAHEAAHKAAGGTMTGPVSYTYTRGPDGKSYVTGGEVPISVSPGKTPQETASRMQQVIQAALAPADPSPQDRAVAAQAASLAQQARQEESAPTTPATPSATSANTAQAESASKTISQASRKAYGDSAVTGLQEPSNNRPTTGNNSDSIRSTISSAYPEANRANAAGIPSATIAGFDTAHLVSFHV